MYLIVNKTGINIPIVGNFPTDLVNQMLEKGEDIIVVSSYSNTIKVPFLNENNEWDWKEYRTNINIVG
jgi:hypothetical protein